MDDELEYEDVEDVSPRPITRTLVAISGAIGGAILAAAAGYFIGWAIALVLDKFVNGGAS